jgi:hypothetical protein
MAQTDPIIARSEAGGKPVVRDGESTRRKRGKPAKTPVEVRRWPKGFGKMAPRLSPRTHLIRGQLNGRGKVYCLVIYWYLKGRDSEEETVQVMATVNR